LQVTSASVLTTMLVMCVCVCVCWTPCTLAVEWSGNVIFTSSGYYAI